MFWYSKAILCSYHLINLLQIVFFWVAFVVVVVVILVDKGDHPVVLDIVVVVVVIDGLERGLGDEYVLLRSVRK